jgi:carbon-monoxide dehydrogenase medium subunit
MSVKHYFTPTTIAECLELLNTFEGRASLIAGGTDLMLWLEKGKRRPEILIDTTLIPEIGNVTVSGDEVSIGAAVTHAIAAVHPWLSEKVPVLADACMSVGSPQIRNVGTLAGNVVAAQPAADSAIALVALGATAEIVSAGARRVEPVKDLYAGIGKSKVDHTREMITCFRFRVSSQNMGTAFERIAPRKASALPVVNVGVVLQSERGVITKAGIAMGPVARHPFTPEGAERMLVGTKAGDEAAWRAAGVQAAREANPRDSLLRGSAEYRRVLVQDLVARAIRVAAGRAFGSKSSGRPAQY